MHDVRNVPQIADIEQAMVRRAVVAAQAGAIHAKRDIQVLQRDVMNDHVVGALHERRINGEEWFHSLRRESARKERCVFLGDPDIEIAIGMLRLEKSETGSARHRAGDRHDLLIRVRKFRERFADNFRISRRRRRRGLAAFDLVFAEPVKLVRLGQRRLVAFAFFRQDVEQNRLVLRLSKIRKCG